MWVVELDLTPSFSLRAFVSQPSLLVVPLQLTVKLRLYLSRPSGVRYEFVPVVRRSLRLQSHNRHFPATLCSILSA